jgi:hypothetical protein
VQDSPTNLNGGVMAAMAKECAAAAVRGRAWGALLHLATTQTGVLHQSP